VQTRSDRLSLAGVGADGLPCIYTGTGQEAKGGDGAACVITHQRVRVWVSDGEGAYNHSIPNSRQERVLS